MRRLVRRVLLVLGLVFVSAVVVVAPAHADLCKDAPAPVAPKSGLPGLLTTVPQDIPASAPDPFADPTIPIGDVYGYSWHWSNYDLGCGNDFLRDPGAVTNTATGNLLLSIADAVTAGLASLEQMAKGSPWEWLASSLQGILSALQGPILSLWFPVATLGLAVMVIWRAKKAAYHETAKTAAVFAASVALAVFGLVYPATLSTQVDKAVTTTADITGQTFSASPTDAINRESGYRTWLTGAFGDADSPSAKKYGPRLMSATHYTWSDWQRIQREPAAKDSIDQAKAAEFKKIAGQLETEDPTAYEVFTGRGERTGPALFGIVNVAAMGLFVGVAALMVLFARVTMQGLTLVAPIAAVVGIFPKFHGVLAKLWDLFTASIVAVAKFTLAGGVMAIVLGAVQGADIASPAKLFFVVVATAVAIVLTKPIRSMKTILPGVDANQSYLKKLVQHVGPALVGGAGSYAGVREGTRDAREDEPTPVAEPAPSLGPLDPPEPTKTSDRENWQPGDWQRRHGRTSPGQEPPPRWVQVRPEPAAALHLDLEPAPTPMRALPTVQGPQRDPGELEGEPAPRRALPAARTALPGAYVEPAQHEAPTTPPTVTSPDAVQPEPPHYQPDPSEVAHPTAVIVTSDPTRYHPDGPTNEYLVPTTEIEMAEDGTEHERIVYHSKADEA